MTMAGMKQRPRDESRVLVQAISDYGWRFAALHQRPPTGAEVGAQVGITASYAGTIISNLRKQKRFPPSLLHTRYGFGLATEMDASYRRKAEQAQKLAHRQLQEWGLR